MSKDYILWVVEDDPVQLKGIIEMITATCAGGIFQIKSVGGAADLASALTGSERPDAVLMDIDLGADAPSGVELVRAHFDLAKTRVIYTTAFLNLVTDAYRTEHSYLLAKPVKQEQLEFALAKVARSLGEKRQETLSFSFGSSVKNVPCSSIIWLESSKHRVEIHTRGNIHSTYDSLRCLTEKLPRYFVKTHKSYVANLRHVYELKHGELVMEDGSIVPVSRHYQHAVKDALMAELGMRAR